ncbi:MAG: CBS domain-containing protein [Halovenus sp.]|uniref:CBS domain-containing protein n=1 Tax=Halovenus amylolytica TaxID=2500550 RepID=UPI000FE43F48
MTTTVSEIMTTPVLTVDPERSLDEIADAMLDQGIKSIAVIDDDCTPVGILTSTDFIEVVSADQSGAELTVSEYMTTEIVTAPAEISVTQAAAEMVEHKISHLPVIEDGTVVGIVTSTDIARHVGTEK